MTTNTPAWRRCCRRWRDVAVRGAAAVARATRWDVLPGTNWLPVAGAAARLSSLEDGLPRLPAVAAGRHLGAPARCAAGRLPRAGRARPAAERWQHGRAGGEDDQRRRPAGLRRRQEGFRQEAPPPGLLVSWWTRSCWCSAPMSTRPTCRSVRRCRGCSTEQTGSSPVSHAYPQSRSAASVARCRAGRWSSAPSAG